MKTETKHTPGPWRMRACPKMFAVDTVEVGGGPILHTDNEANARLIAAAPDLLESVQHLIALLDENIPSRLDDDEWEAVTLAKAAIAKATQPEGAES